MSISGISARVCYQSQSAVDRVFCAQEAEGVCAYFDARLYVAGSPVDNPPAGCQI